MSDETFDISIEIAISARVQVVDLVLRCLIQQPDITTSGRGRLR